jgi:hypothetical protein
MSDVEVDVQIAQRADVWIDITLDDHLEIGLLLCRSTAEFTCSTFDYGVVLR